MFVGLIAGFIGYSWLDNLVRSKVLGYLDWKQNGQPPASSPTPPATKQAAVGTV